MFDDETRLIGISVDADLLIAELRGSMAFVDILMVEFDFKLP